MKCWNMRAMVLVCSVLFLTADRVRSNSERRTRQTRVFSCDDSHNRLTVTEVFQEAISDADGLGEDLTEITCNDQELIGQIPSETSILERLVTLELLELVENSITGSIPSSLAQLTSLTKLRLKGNQLIGTVPVELGQLEHLTALNLGINQLEGTLPMDLFDLNELRSLALGSNDFIGTIPEGVSRLKHLETLGLGLCNFEGTIPSEMMELVSLTSLFLGNNALTGTVPSTISQLTNLGRLFLGNNEGLFGTMPDHSATDTDTPGGSFLGPLPPSAPPTATPSTFLTEAPSPSPTATSSTSFEPTISSDSDDLEGISSFTNKSYVVMVILAVACGIAIMTGLLVREKRIVQKLQSRVAIGDVSL